MRLVIGCDHEGCSNAFQLGRSGIEPQLYAGGAFTGPPRLPKDRFGVYIEMLAPYVAPAGWSAEQVPWPELLRLYCPDHAPVEGALEAASAEPGPGGAGGLPEHVAGPEEGATRAGRGLDGRLNPGDWA